jgi:hypothetical protein
LNSENGSAVFREDEKMTSARASLVVYSEIARKQTPESTIFPFERTTRANSSRAFGLMVIDFLFRSRFMASLPDQFLMREKAESQAMRIAAYIDRPSGEST